ncbi:MAG: YceI family protein [Myxococcales bacterium]|nr:YceI family protein [Myxococcales bacterium]
MRSIGARVLWPLLAAAALASGKSAAESWSLDRNRSELAVNVFRAGALSPLLHDHHFVAERWSMELQLDPRRPSEASVQVTVDASSLVDHQPKLSEENRAEVRDQVRSPLVLDADRHPSIRFTSERVTVRARDEAGRPTAAEVRGTLELHGRARPLTVPLRLAWTERSLRAEGNLRFLQSDFGIRPFRRALGSIAVKDEVEVELKATAVKGER